MTMSEAEVEQIALKVAEKVSTRLEEKMTAKITLHGAACEAKTEIAKAKASFKTATWFLGVMVVVFSGVLGWAVHALVNHIWPGS